MSWDDNSWNDYLAGCAGFATGSVINEIGRQHGGHFSYGAPHTSPAVTESNAKGQLPLARSPRKLITDEEKKRREKSIHGIIRTLSLREKIGGSISTFLDEIGRPLVDESGDFTIEETVPRAEHFKRLHRYCANRIEGTLSFVNRLTAERDFSIFKPLHLSALRYEYDKRAKYIERKRYVAPVEKSGHHWQSRWFGHYSSGFLDIFRDDVRDVPLRIVNIAEYDRRFRIFAKRAYGLTGINYSSLDGTLPASLPGKELLLIYTNAPSALNGPYPKKLRRMAERSVSVQK